MRTLLVACLVVLSAFSVACGVAGTKPATPAVGKTAPATTSREDFRKAVMGKTTDEVIEAVGKPDRTVDNGKAGWISWKYEKRTTDPLTGKTDSVTTVIIEDGKVTDVFF